MTPAVQAAIDRLANAGQRDLAFVAARRQSVKRMESPAGVWFLADSIRDALAFERENPGAAVFTRDEIRDMQPFLARSDTATRQALLGDLIALRSLFGVTQEPIRLNVRA